MPESQANVTLNVPVPKSLSDKVNGDVERFRRSKQDIVFAIISDFYRENTLAERAKLFSVLPKKGKGRPVKEDR